MGLGFRVVFEDDGYPRELIDFADWERAVKDGSLTTDMTVTVYRAGQNPVVMKVSDIEEIRSLFEPAKAEPTSSTLSPPPPQEDALRGPPAGQEVTEPSKVFASKPEPSETREEAAWRRPPATRELEESRSPKHLGVIVGLVAAIVGVILLVKIGTSPSPQQEPPSPPIAVNSVPQDDHVPITESKIYEWQNSSNTNRYRFGDILLTFSTFKDAESDLPVPSLAVTSPELGEVTLAGVAGFGNARARFAIVRPNSSDSHASVLLMTFSGGAHCCTNVKLLTPVASGWKAVDLGNWDGEPFNEAPTDVDQDGQLDFVLNDNAFLYEFASYADSLTPSLIFNVRQGEVVDVSASPAFASIHRADMEVARGGCLNGNNGACAAFVASAARLGEAEAALQFTAINYDRSAIWDLPTRCRIPNESGDCPSDLQQRPSDFLQALHWFLEDRGYIAALTPSSDWLVGAWSPVGCAADTGGYYFHRNGNYADDDYIGRWRMEGANLILTPTLRRNSTGEDVPIEGAQPSVHPIERISDSELRVGGAGSKMVRCALGNID